MAIWAPFRLFILVAIFRNCYAREEDSCVDQDWSWGRFYIYESTGETIADAIKKDEVWLNAASKIIDFAKAIGQKRIDDGKFLRCLKHDSSAMGPEFDNANGKMKSWGFGALEKVSTERA